MKQPNYETCLEATNNLKSILEHDRGRRFEDPGMDVLIYQLEEFSDNDREEFNNFCENVDKEIVFYKLAEYYYGFEEISRRLAEDILWENTNIFSTKEIMLETLNERAQDMSIPDLYELLEENGYGGNKKVSLGGTDLGDKAIVESFMLNGIVFEYCNRKAGEMNKELDERYYG